jgi:predicted transcriptional regulator
VSTIDDYLRLLADERKRRLLRALREAEGEPISVASDDPDERARLHHVHLPKLSDAGLIDWDPRDDLAVRGPAFDEVVPLLDAIDDLGRAGDDGGSENGSEGDESDDSDDGE